MIRNLVNRLAPRGRERTRANEDAGTGAIRSGPGRSPPDRLQAQSPQRPASPRPTVATQIAVAVPARRIADAPMPIATVSDEVILESVLARARGPYPPAFRNTREAMLADAHASSFGDPGDDPAKLSAIATDYVFAHVQPSTHARIMADAKKLGAVNVVRMLKSATEPVATPMRSSGFMIPEQMRPRDAMTLDGGLVIVAQGDPYPVRYWSKTTNTWTQMPLVARHGRDAHRAFVPNAIAPTSDGFAIFDNAGSIHFFRTPKDGDVAAEALQVIAEGPTRRAWTAATSLADGRMVAVTREGTVHVFAHADGTWREEKMFKAGHALDHVVPVALGFAVSGDGNDAIIIYDERLKTQKVHCDRPVARSTPLNDGTFLSIDSQGHAQVWSSNGKKWTPSLITYAAGACVAVEDGFVTVTSDFLTHWQRERDGWSNTPQPIKLPQSASNIRALFKVDSGIAVLFNHGADPLVEISGKATWMPSWVQCPARAPNLYEALSQGNLILARELLRGGEVPDAELMTAASGLQLHDSTIPSTRAAVRLLMLAYSDGVTLLDTQGRTLLGAALSQGASPEMLERAAQHVALGATVTDGDVASVRAMAKQDGMLPILAALIYQGRLTVAEVPARVTRTSLNGLTLAMCIARFDPVDVQAVTDAGERFGFFPENMESEAQKSAALQIVAHVDPARIVAQYRGNPKRSPDPLAQAVVLTAMVEGAELALKRLIAQGDLTFWSQSDWEARRYSPPAEKRLRAAGMPPAILARYAATRAYANWTPAPAPQPMTPAQHARWLYESVARRPETVYFEVPRDDPPAYAKRLRRLNAKAVTWQRAWRMTFTGEDGIDEGGLSREWVAGAIAMLTAKDGIMPPFDGNKSYTYFKTEDPSLMGDDVASPKHEEDLVTMGHLFGRAIMLGMTTDVALPPHLMDMLVGRSPRVDLDALQHFDPAAATGLQWMLDHPDEIPETTFGTDDSGEVVALREGISKDTLVTADNVQAYVDAKAEYILVKRFAGATRAFLRGVFSVVDARLLRTFTSTQLAKITTGALDFDTTKWREATGITLTSGDAQQAVTYHALQALRTQESSFYQGVPQRAQLTDWFFEALDAMDQTDRGIVFEAVTVSKRVPAAGFAALPNPFLLKFAQDFGGARPVNIAQPFAGLGLPKVSTCDCSITLPDYPDAQTMHDAMRAYVEYFRNNRSFDLE